MTAPYIPDDWHKQKTPEEWQAINRKAMADFHASMAHDPSNPNREALEAIKDSNEALNAYDAPAITAGEHTLSSGFGNPISAVKGVAEGGLDALLSPFHTANTIYRQGPGAAIDEMVSGIKSIPGEITSGDPERIGRVAGNVAGGIATAKLGGRLAKGVGGAVSDLAERPGLKNNLLRAQTQQALNNVDKSTSTLSDAIKQSSLKTQAMEQGIAHKADLHPDAVEQAGLKTNRLHQDVAQKAGTIKPTVDQANLRTDLMKQQLEKGATDLTRNKGTVDELIKRAGLQNDLTELQIEKLRRALEEGNDEGDAGPSGSAPNSPTPSTTGPGGNKIYDPNERPDPYGLNDILDQPKSPNPPPENPDVLGEWIKGLKAQQNVNDMAPHDLLGPDLGLGPRPLTPEQINQLLNGLNKPKG